MGAHDVTLQRLDVFHRNNGVETFYTPEYFKNVESWARVPVVMPTKAKPGNPIKHPDHTAVAAGLVNNPDYKIVGYVDSATLSNAGEPALNARIVLDDPTANELAGTGKLSLSTGFDAKLMQLDSTRAAVAGAVAPNHVLVFPRNMCPNCTPNDKGAVFHNLEGGKMAENEESVGFFKKILAKLDNIEESKKTEVKQMDNTEVAALKAEIDALKAENAENKKQIGNLSEIAAQAKRDTQWAAMSNVLPAGWMGDKEADTRKEFEADPAGFVLKLTAHNTAHPAEVKAAEGKKSVGNVEEAFKTEVETFSKEFGLTFADGE